MKVHTDRPPSQGAAGTSAAWAPGLLAPTHRPAGARASGRHSGHDPHAGQLARGTDLVAAWPCALWGRS
jgi:hypothetical protein